MAEDISEMERTIMKEMRRLKLTDDEVKNFLRQVRKPEKVKRTYDHFYGSSTIKIGVISDTHFGSKYFDEELFFNSVNVFNKEKVKAIYHAGDVIEGMSNREGHIYELKNLGVSEQIKEASKYLKMYKQPLFFITGNHDDWSSKKSNQGMQVGPMIESLVPNSKFLGEYVADVKLAPNITMRLTHEGNTAYALSYSAQKRINAISGGDKPEILVNGHLHKALYMFYRNIHTIEGATFQDQTPFLRMKGSPVMKGYYVLEIGYNKNGVNKFVPKFYPGY